MQSVSSYDAIPRGSHHGRRQSEEEGSAKNDNDDVVLDMPHAVGASGPRARVEGMSLVGLFFNLLLYPLFFFVPLFTSFYTVAPQQHVLVTFWGSLAKVAKRPGVYWFPVFGRSMVAIPTSMQTLDIKRATVVDKNGNPIVVSGVVTFQVVDSVRAAFDVINYVNYIELQAVAVLKRVCSMYPYECRTGKSLQSESREVSALLVRLLQEKSEAAGARVISYELADLQYAPEIAPGMLVRQQAHALVEARHTIVEGAVSIVTSAVTKLSENGIHLNDTQQSRLVSNLLAVICSDSHVTPTFSVSDGDTNEQEAQEEAVHRKQMMTLLAQIAANTTAKGQ